MKFPFKKIDINKSTALLGLAIAIGLLAAFAARSYLANRMDAIDARGKANLVNVVVAKDKLQKGDVISSETVAVRSVPADYAHSSALMPNQFDTFDGKALTYAVNAGEIIIWSMLETQKTPTFSARVEAGRRAITVPVDEINSISGLLEPGDLVDLMLTVNQEEKKYTFPVLQAVKVMATGQRSVDDPKSGERRQYSTVTLDATLEQAQNVIAAREAGKITALLRNPTDVKEVLGASKTLASVLGLGGAGRGGGTYGSLAIPVLYGGKGGKLPTEGMQLNATSRRVAGAPFPALTPETQEPKSGADTGGVTGGVKGDVSAIQP